eukprot:173470-Amorphochlora_amoeboformis.AAC.1
MEGGEKYEKDLYCRGGWGIQGKSGQTHPDDVAGNCGNEKLWRAILFLSRSLPSIPKPSLNKLMLGPFDVGCDRMSEGEASAGSGKRADESKNPVPAHTTRRPRERCPLNKLSVRLLDTYNNINQFEIPHFTDFPFLSPHPFPYPQRYYAQKGLEAKKKKKRARQSSKEYDYHVVEGAYLGEGNRYKIEREIGKGSFGKVVRAFDNVKKEWVAIKIVKKKKAFLRQAETEIKILNALQEPPQGEPSKIVQLKHHFKHEKHQCIVFELLYRNLYELLIDTQYKVNPNPAFT